MRTSRKHHLQSLFENTIITSLSQFHLNKKMSNILNGYLWQLFRSSIGFKNDYSITVAHPYQINTDSRRSSLQTAKIKFYDKYSLSF